MFASAIRSPGCSIWSKGAASTRRRERRQRRWRRRRTRRRRRRRREVGEGEDADAPKGKLKELDGDYRFAREQACDLRLFDFESFGGFGKEVRSTLREAANQLSNKLSHAQHLDEVTWTTKNWHGLQMQRLSVVLHTAVAWQTVNELACGESGIVHGAECIAVLNGVA